jgi:hypothetical protein
MKKYNRFMSETLELSREQLEVSIVVIENTLAPLIDRHLAWVPLDESASAKISDQDYGTMPAKFNDILIDSPISIRPKREPVHFEKIASTVLGIDPNSPNFENRVRQVDGHSDLAEAVDIRFGNTTGSASQEKTNGWYSYLLRNGMSLPEVRRMKEVSEDAYRLNTLTEDNLPSYVLETMFAVRTAAKELGVVVPALEEWFRGIWPREEDAHKISMNAYGQIRKITTSELHSAGRNSQLLTGSTERPEGVIEVFCYTPRQEFATKLAHHRDGMLMGPVGYQLTKEISQDETRHEDVYTNVLKALLNEPQLASIVVKTLAASYRNFFMPGQDGIPKFFEHSRDFNEAKIYGLYEDFIAAKHVLRKLGLFDKDENKSYINPAGLDEKAMEDVHWLRKKFDKDRVPVYPSTSALFVLGKTITVEELRKVRRDYMKEMGLVTSN